MPRLLLALLLIGCATERESVVEDPACCRETEAPAPAAAPSSDDGRDFAARIEGPARCEREARALLPAAPEQAWRMLWGCVQTGHFTALRQVLSGAWDRQLQTRADAPLLVARVIADRGGDVDGDLALVHGRRVPLFSLSQALAQPERFRGALVIVRARVSLHGVLSETRLVGQLQEIQLGPAERTVRRAPPPYNEDTRFFRTRPRGSNLDVVTGQRVLAVTDDPFLDEGETQVVLGRFDGLRDGDAWPVVSVLEHFAPSATLSY
jgi:hypothetical protein